MSDNILFINLETQKTPNFIEKKGKDWVYYGDDNLYPDYLVELYQRSSTHNAIINGKVSYTIGEGWSSTDKGVNLIVRSQITQFIESINEDEGINELTEKIALDFEIFNGFYLEVRRSKNSKDFKLNHIPFNKIRTNLDMSVFYYSKDWSITNQTPEKTGLKEYKAFDPESKESVSIYYYKILSPRKGNEPNVYPIPTYIGGTQAIETEIECSNFNLSEIKTNFSAGTMIAFNNGIPSVEEQKTIKRNIEKEMQGSEGAKFIVTFADSKDRGSEVITLNGNNLPERYMNVQKSSMRTIFTAHRVSSPSLFGVQQENVTFGSRAEIAEQYEIFQNTYISHRQRCIESVFNGFAKLKGLPGKLILKPTKAIQNDIFTEQTILQLMPTNAIKQSIAERIGIDLSKYPNTLAQQVLDKLNSLSPLVSNKVLESLQPNEIRELLGYTNNGNQNVANNSSTFNSEITPETFLKQLEGKGKSKDEYEIVKEISINFGQDLDEAEEHFFEEEKADSIVVKPKGKEQIKKKLEDGFEYMYYYDWRPEFKSQGSKLIDSSRDFCKELLRKNLLYTKQELQSDENEMGTNLWKYAGGWYTKPNTNTHLPYCRHTWVQALVKKK